MQYYTSNQAVKCSTDFYKIFSMNTVVCIAQASKILSGSGTTSSTFSKILSLVSKQFFEDGTTLMLLTM